MDVKEKAKEIKEAFLWYKRKRYTVDLRKRLELQINLLPRFKIINSRRNSLNLSWARHVRPGISKQREDIRI